MTALKVIFLILLVIPFAIFLTVIIAKLKEEEVNANRRAHEVEIRAKDSKLNSSVNNERRNARK